MRVRNDAQGQRDDGGLMKCSSAGLQKSCPVRKGAALLRAADASRVPGDARVQSGRGARSMECSRAGARERFRVGRVGALRFVAGAPTPSCDPRVRTDAAGAANSGDPGALRRGIAADLALPPHTPAVPPPARAPRRIVRLPVWVGSGWIARQYPCHFGVTATFTRISLPG